MTTENPIACSLELVGLAKQVFAIDRQQFPPTSSLSDNVGFWARSKPTTTVNALFPDGANMTPKDVEIPLSERLLRVVLKIAQDQDRDLVLNEETIARINEFAKDIFPLAERSESAMREFTARLLESDKITEEGRDALLNKGNHPIEPEKRIIFAKPSLGF